MILKPLINYTFLHIILYINILHNIFINTTCIFTIYSYTNYTLCNFFSTQNKILEIKMYELLHKQTLELQWIIIQITCYVFLTFGHLMNVYIIF